MGMGSSLDRRIHSLFKRGVLDGNLSVLGTLTSSGALAVTGALSLTGNAVIASTALTGTGLLINKVANTGPTVKAHCHQLAASSTVVGDQVVANEFKGEFLDTIGTMDGIASHFRMSASGTGIMRAILGVAYLDAAKTMSGTDYTTESWLVGGCFVANAGGILNGAGVIVAGLYGGISSCVGSTLTAAKYVASIWADSNRLVTLSSGISALILATAQAGAAEVGYGLKIEANGYIGVGIDLSGTYTGHGIYIHGATFASGKRAFRIGDYGTEIVLAAGEGIIRSYAKITSGTDATALQFHWGFTDVAAALIGSQMQMESHAATPGPNGVTVLDLIANVEDSKYIAAGGDGLIGLRSKVTSGNGGNINGNVFALWLDHQINVAGPNAIEASIRGTTGGSKPDAFIQLETTSGGWSQFLKLDASMATKEPFVSTGCSVTVATVPYLKVDINGTQYGIPLIAI